MDPGSSAVVQIRLEVDTFVGGDSGTDTDSTSVAGTALAELGPGNEAFTEMTINDLSLDLDSMNFSYDFFCVPIFGCSISADLNVSGFNLGVAEAISGAIQSNGNVVFNDALFNPSLSYDVNISGLISSSISGSISEVAAQTFSCTVDAANQSVSVTNFGIDQVIYDIDPAELPSGVDNVRIIATVDLTNVSMSGTYTEAMEGDLN